MPAATCEQLACVITSPIGPLTLSADESGEALTGLGFGPSDPRVSSLAAPATGVLEEAARQLSAYFDRRLTRFDLPLRADGTPFQQRVWAELLKIPYGTTISYGQLARAVGDPGASRAVGSANGRNPIAIIIPCHRVIQTGGGLGGFGGGLPIKRQLLSLESPSALWEARA